MNIRLAEIRLVERFVSNPSMTLEQFVKLATKKAGMSESDAKQFFAGMQAAMKDLESGTRPNC